LLKWGKSLPNSLDIAYFHLAPHSAFLPLPIYLVFPEDVDLFSRYPHSPRLRNYILPCLLPRFHSHTLSNTLT